MKTSRKSSGKNVDIIYFNQTKRWRIIVNYLFIERSADYTEWPRMS